jgi:hypothetical protein
MAPGVVMQNNDALEQQSRPFVSNDSPYPVSLPTSHSAMKVSPWSRITKGRTTLWSQTAAKIFFPNGFFDLICWEK